MRKYIKKRFLSKSEKKFYYFLTQFELEKNIKIIPQINLSSIIHKPNATYRNELHSRNIDFGIFDKNFNLLLLIEFNDKSHDKQKTKERDYKVQKICKIAKIDLIPTTYKDFFENPTTIKEKLSKEIDLRINKYQSNFNSNYY